MTMHPQGDPELDAMLASVEAQTQRLADLIGSGLVVFDVETGRTFAAVLSMVCTWLESQAMPYVTDTDE